MFISSQVMPKFGNYSSFDSLTIDFTKEGNLIQTHTHNTHLIHYICSGCWCYDIGNRSEFSKSMEEYSMYGWLGLDKNKVISF